MNGAVAPAGPCTCRPDRERDGLSGQSGNQEEEEEEEKEGREDEAGEEDEEWGMKRSEDYFFGR